MIIGFPTALYEPALPQEPQNSGNVTFIISSTNPPRSDDVLFQLLRSEELRQLPERIFTREQRRTNYGDFVFDISFGTQSVTGDGRKAFEVGQLLDFDDIEDPEALTTLEVPETVELQQNTNVLDLESLGLTEEESDLLISGATTKFGETVESLNNLKTQINDTQIGIADNQRLINETRKARDAAKVVFEGSTDITAGNEIIDKLDIKESELLLERETLIALLEVLTDQANEIYNEILDVKEVVR